MENSEEQSSVRERETLSPTRGGTQLAVLSSDLTGSIASTRQ